MIKFKTIMLCVLAGIILTGAIYAQDPPTYTAYDLQTYNGVHEGDRIRFVGIVTVESARYGYSLTVGADDVAMGEYRGIAIYDIDQRLAAERGDYIEVVGILSEYYDKTEINCSDETEFPPIVTGHGSAPGPVDITCLQADSEPYENCLIRLTNLEVLGNPDEYGSIPVTDATGHEFTLLLRLIDPPPAVGYVYSTCTGDDDYHFGEFKIRPRDEGDWGTGDPTPTPTGGPSPTPTGQPSCMPTMELEFSGFDDGHCFSTGENFNPLFKMTNECAEGWQVDFFIALRVATSYYFYPFWEQTIDHGEASISAGSFVEGDVLQPFNWPAVDGHFSDMQFIGLMTYPESYDVVGNIPMLDFCY